MTTDRLQLSPQNQGWRQLYSERRFSILLAVLAALLMGAPILLGFGMSVTGFDGLVSILVLAEILSLCFEPKQRLFALVLGIPSVLLSTDGYALTGDTGEWVLFVGHLCQVLFFLSAAVLIIRSTFDSGALTFDSIVGAVCGLFIPWAGLGRHLFVERKFPARIVRREPIADPGGRADQHASPGADVFQFRDPDDNWLWRCRSDLSHNSHPCRN